MQFFLEYMRQRRRGLLLFLLACAVFCVSFFLYRLPVAAVLYPAFLCALLGAFFLLRDFLRVKKRHGILLRAREMTAATLSELPCIESLEDRDYQEVIRALQRETAALQEDLSAQYQDRLEYYTVWVHQIKTPITSMRLSLEAEDTPLSRKLSSDLRQIEQYVEMVLAFLRLDSPTTDYVFKEYDIDGIVGQSVAKFASEFIARKIRLDYTPLEIRAVTDDKWLSFVIEQILSNALKYTPRGCVKIYRKEKKTFCIEDTGIGIAPEDLPRVFEKGYTGYNGREDKRASGIGLYLCRQVCDRLGIGIGIASEPGRGTCVSIDLEQYELKRE